MRVLSLRLRLLSMPVARRPQSLVAPPRTAAVLLQSHRRVVAPWRGLATLAEPELRKVEGRLMEKYRPVVESITSFHISDDSLSESITEAVASVGHAEEQKRFDGIPAAPPPAAPTGASPLDGFAKRGKSQEEMYMARAEAELLRKLRSKLAGTKKARESPSNRLKGGAGGTTAPRRAAKSGSSPLQTRQRGLEEEYIRRMEAEVLEKLRAKRRAAEEAAAAAASDGN